MLISAPVTDRGNGSVDIRELHGRFQKEDMCDYLIELACRDRTYLWRWPNGGYIFVGEVKKVHREVELPVVHEGDSIQDRLGRYLRRSTSWVICFSNNEWTMSLSNAPRSLAGC